MINNDIHPTTTKQSEIYRLIKSHNINILNRLRSIDEDARFIWDIYKNYYKGKLSIFANLRAGQWYINPKECYKCIFKSTDSHKNNYNFSTTRLNLNILEQSILNPYGLLIIDSTRKGKRYPDSFSKTIPIWCCIMNCLALEYNVNINKEQWDTNLNLPLWISNIEKDLIQTYLDNFLDKIKLTALTDHLITLLKQLSKPLRVLWVNRDTNLWTLDILKDLPFYPLLCISCSKDEYDTQMYHRNGWYYIQGAGDDEENWITNTQLTPDIYWSFKDQLLSFQNNEDLLLYIEQMHKNQWQIIKNKSNQILIKSERIISNQLEYIYHLYDISLQNCFFMFIYRLLFI